MGKVYKVKDTMMFVQEVEVYENGIETTAGFYKQEQLEESNCVSITFDSKHAIELPINWPDLSFLDDNNERLRIVAIDFESGDKPAYTMGNGKRSYTVTI